MPHGLVVRYNAFRSMVVLFFFFFGEYPRGAFLHKKEKKEFDHWESPILSAFIKLSFKALKAMLSNISHKIGSVLLLFSKT